TIFENAVSAWASCSLRRYARPSVRAVRIAASRSRLPPAGSLPRPRQPARSSVVAMARPFRAGGLIVAGNIVPSLPGDKATRYGSRRDVSTRAAARPHTVFLGAVLLVVALNRGRPDERGGAGAAPPGFSLRDVAHQAGIDFVHHAPTLDHRIDNVAPLMAALGASVSVSDVNNDGWPDLYFTNSRFGFPNALYLNRGDGTFVDVARSAGVADLNRPGEGVSMGAAWGDYDNDGLEDLLVYKWGYLQLFHNLDGLHFEDVTAAAGLRQWMNSNGAVWFDYDRDGLLDLYVTGYFRSDIDLWHLKTTRIMHNSFEFATNGGKNRLFHNLGNGRFEDVTDQMGVGSTRW